MADQGLEGGVLAASPGGAGVRRLLIEDSAPTLLIGLKIFGGRAVPGGRLKRGEQEVMRFQRSELHSAQLRLKALALVVIDYL